jgi:Family of unknown function (DUF6599)
MSRKVSTNTSQKQTFISLAILGVLVVIAGGIFFVQFNDNPALQPVTSGLSAGKPNETAPIVSLQKSLISFPSGQAPLSPLETFDAAGLSDKIDGKAELYLTAGFVRLDSQRFEDKTAGDVWMEVFVYDMQSTQNAFSVFSAQRREDAQTIAIAQYAYQTQNALFFVHGPYYVEIVASDVSESIIEPMIRFAEAFIEKHPVKTQMITEKELFPKQGLVPNSISLVAADAFGYDRFDQIFTATYRLDDIELVAFFSRRKTSREAQALATGYLDFLATFGGEPADVDPGIEAAKMIYILDTYEIVFSHGAYLAGVREAAEKQPAQELAMQLLNRIKEVSDESGPQSEN